jgi:hypothetical protein
MARPGSLVVAREHVEQRGRCVNVPAGEMSPGGEHVDGEEGAAELDDVVVAVAEDTFERLRKGGRRVAVPGPAQRAQGGGGRQPPGYRKQSIVGLAVGAAGQLFPQRSQALGQASAGLVVRAGGDLFQGGGDLWGTDCGPLAEARVAHQQRQHRRDRPVRPVVPEHLADRPTHTRRVIGPLVAAACLPDDERRRCPFVDVLRAVQQ